MVTDDPNQNAQDAPAYSIAEMMTLMKKDEIAIRKLIKSAGVEIDLLRQDPSERIPYDDFRRLWISLANRRDGQLLSTLLIENSESWFDIVFRRQR
jgi:hypothetical protein